MVQRETTPDLINRIANHPSVWPYVARHGEVVDFTPAFPMAHSGIVVLTNGEDAAMVFEQTAERAWQVCSMFQDTCRGERSRKVAAEMRDYMLPEHADVVFGLVPKDYPHAKKFYEDLGGRQVPHVAIGDDLYLPTETEDMYELRAN